MLPPINPVCYNTSIASRFDIRQVSLINLGLTHQPPYLVVVNTKRDKCLLQIAWGFFRSQETGVRSRMGITSMPFISS